jgi:alpha,alpha-trehalase
MEPTDDFEKLRQRWPQFESTLLDWWKGDFRTAHENDVRRDDTETFLYLPFPFSSAGGSEAAFPEMYAWDTYFMNLAMLRYGLLEPVEHHLRNQLFMIERYGFVPNGNRTFYLGRSQPPLHADMILRFVEVAEEGEAFAHQAYPLLKREFRNYWCAPHHLFPMGLHTNRDLLEQTEPSENDLRALPLLADLNDAMLAEAETGLDFCPNFEGEVRNFAPLITNCALIRYLEVLEILSARLGLNEAEMWRTERENRIRLVRENCWDPEGGFFHEYQVPENRRGLVRSLCGFLPLWAGFATVEEAERVVANLNDFKQPFGLSQTDREWPSPYPRFGHVQWNHPAGWPPFQVFTWESLRRYGFVAEAQACEAAWLRGALRLYDQTGKIYEKYNVVDGTLILPKERQDSIPPLHGWSTASCLLAGLALFGRQSA